MTESNQSSIYKSGMESWTLRVGDQCYTLNADTCSCPICFKRFLNGYNMRRHIRTIHLEERTLKLCDKCDASFSTEAALVHHVRFAHEKTSNASTKVDITAKNDDKKECPDCEKLISKKNFWKHMKEMHKNTKYNTDLTDVFVYSFKCGICDFVTKRKHDLKRHNMRMHSDVQVSFPCSVCEKSFPYEQNLKRHMKSHGNSEN